MKKWTILMSCALGLSLVACGNPYNPPQEEDDVDITGVIVRDDGSPAVDVGVTLGSGETLLGDTTTDADGRYQFKVMADDTRDLPGGSLSLLSVRARLQAADPTPEVGFDFTAQRRTMTVPTMRFFETPVVFVTTGHTCGDSEVAVFKTAYEDAQDRDPEHLLIKVLTADGYEVISEEIVGATQACVSTLLLEDWVTSWRMIAQLADNTGGSFINGFAAGLPTELEAQNPTPVSRGKACTYASYDARTPAVISPCPITDGSLNTAFTPGAAICTDSDPDDAADECFQAWERLVIDLEEIRDITTVAVHNMAEGVTIAVDSSVTGESDSFEGIGGISGDNFVWSSTPAPRQVRYLRFGFTGSSTESVLEGINEIFVY